MPNSDDREQRIRERAYALWQQAGSPEGQHETFWHQAKAEERAREERTSDADDGSFPASDPHSNTGITGPGR
ncbi:DUF2934 domain-containing protein [Acidiphilium sp. AL]|uniref:DUF2934 domain-containing protein n=1 Tax=Acidiphilium iwatense TaxID=768198 RepID=A0ABS9DU15_9PROT|nr:MULTISPECIES: DUF2934 domain-containing protein [Acidiphilium]MCF3945221.1 DUF2934 domain-containing protein [Acidiphilium iwatense]MCU4159487.1 DUF2934 domain-containing protein [Acidiphilium sp. AL]